MVAAWTKLNFKKKGCVFMSLREALKNTRKHLRISNGNFDKYIDNAVTGNPLLSYFNIKDIDDIPEIINKFNTLFRQYHIKMSRKKWLELLEFSIMIDHDDPILIANFLKYFKATKKDILQIFQEEIRDEIFFNHPGTTIKNVEENIMEQRERIEKLKIIIEAVNNRIKIRNILNEILFYKKSNIAYQLDPQKSRDKEFIKYIFNGINSTRKKNGLDPFLDISDLLGIPFLEI